MLIKQLILYIETYWSGDKHKLFSKRDMEEKDIQPKKFFVFSEFLTIG